MPSDGEIAIGGVQWVPGVEGRGECDVEQTVNS